MAACRAAEWAGWICKKDGTRGSRRLAFDAPRLVNCLARCRRRSAQYRTRISYRSFKDDQSRRFSKSTSVHERGQVQRPHTRLSGKKFARPLTAVTRPPTLGVHRKVTTAAATVTLTPLACGSGTRRPAIKLTPDARRSQACRRAGSGKVALLIGSTIDRVDCGPNPLRVKSQIRRLPIATRMSE
jgi:hypothetical protein